MVGEAVHEDLLAEDDAWNALQIGNGANVVPIAQHVAHRSFLRVADFHGETCRRA